MIILFYSQIWEKPFPKNSILSKYQSWCRWVLPILLYSLFTPLQSLSQERSSPLCLSFSFYSFLGVFLQGRQQKQQQQQVQRLMMPKLISSAAITIWGLTSNHFTNYGKFSFNFIWSTSYPSFPSPIARKSKFIRLSY